MQTLPEETQAGALGFGNTVGTVANNMCTWQVISPRGRGPTRAGPECSCLSFYIIREPLGNYLPSIQNNLSKK